MNALFSQDELISFTQLLVYIAKADGNITNDEEIFLNDFSKQSGLNWKNIKERGIEEILCDFKEFSSRISVIQELVKLSMIDGDYSEPERIGIFTIAKLLLIPEEKVMQIETWVKSGIDWVIEGQQLRIA